MKKKALLVLGALALVLAVTSGALATSRWIVTKSSQVKPGAISYRNLSKAAKHRLRGKVGPQGVPGTPGTPGAPGTNALAQFAGNIGHGTTQCIGQWGKQSPCNAPSYTNGIFFGPLPAGLTVQHLTVAAATAPNVGTLVITVLDNGTATALTCTVATATKTCSDDADSLVTSEGDLIEVQVKNGVTNTVNSKVIANLVY